MCPHLFLVFLIIVSRENCVWKWLFVHHMQTMTSLVQTYCITCDLSQTVKSYLLSPNSIYHLQRELQSTTSHFYNSYFKSPLIRSSRKEMEVTVHFLTSTIFVVKCRRVCEVVALKSLTIRPSIQSEFEVSVKKSSAANGNHDQFGWETMVESLSQDVVARYWLSFNASSAALLPSAVVRLTCSCVVTMVISL